MSSLNVSGKIQDLVHTIPAALLPKGFSHLTLTGTAGGFTAIASQVNSVPLNALTVIICVETNAVRWRDDGTAPTATIGMPLAVGQYYQFSASDFTKVQFIPVSGTSTINACFYG